MSNLSEHMAADTKATSRSAVAERHSDPVVVSARRLFALNQQQNAAVLAWQTVEHAISQVAKRSGVGFEEVCDSDAVEARRLRALGHEIACLDRRIEQQLKRVRTARTYSVDGALARIEAGLSAQPACAWSEGARHLVELGVQELRRLIQQDARLSPQSKE